MHLASGPILASVRCGKNHFQVSGGSPEYAIRFNGLLHRQAQGEGGWESYRAQGLRSFTYHCHQTLSSPKPHPRPLPPCQFVSRLRHRHLIELTVSCDDANHYVPQLRKCPPKI